ncbi:hypothetical protein RvY_12258 [Ramazzottius varieornatus]|uniref:Uncharacterized protein n=1 Tax=Ramazzottius varieornatus TaxID=947166 RepID=A0A1D1VIV9_RAMVA|nr:hypothetical protein RvY_12258 [Ramazzottius varieornatus]
MEWHCAKQLGCLKFRAPPSSAMSKIPQQRRSVRKKAEYFRRKTDGRPAEEIWEYWIFAQQDSTARVCGWDGNT